MIKRYAIEPRAVADPWKLRYVLEKMSFEEGRAILEYPKKKKWIKEVHAKAESQQDNKKITELLKAHGSRAFVGMHELMLDYEPGDWAVNAVKHLSSDCVDGVVFHDRPLFDIEGLKCTDIDSAEDKFFSKRRSSSVECSAKAIANIAKTVIFESRELVLIDPYFNINRISENWVVLEALMDVIKRSPNVSSLIVVCAAEVINFGRGLDKEKLTGMVQTRLFENLREGFHFEYRVINSEKSIHKLHQRYLLTDKAAMKFDRGFSELPSKEGGGYIMQDVLMVDEQTRARNMHNYVGGGGQDIEIELSVTAVSSGQ